MDFSKPLLLFIQLISIEFVQAQTWSPLSSGLNNSVLSLHYNTTGDTLYAGGRFSNAGGSPSNYISRWTNNQWQQVGLGLDNPVRVVTQINGKLFVGGEFAYYQDSILSCFGEWNGNRFVGYTKGFFHSGLHSVAATVNSITSYKNQIYAGGIFDYANNKQDYMKSIAKWNGTHWEDVGGGLDGNSGVNCMIIYHDTLYAGGGFNMAGDSPVKNIAKWDGTTWTNVGGGMNNEVLSLEVWNDTLYAGGVFTQAGGKAISYIARWDGNNWQDVSGGTNGPIYTLKANSSQLFVGGLFTKSGDQTLKNLAAWNGTEWTAIGNPNNMVRCLSTSATSLVAGGDFTNIGGTTVSRIGKTSELSAVTEMYKGSFGVYPNPADDFLMIESTTVQNFDEFLVYSMQGELIYNQPYSPKIDISELRDGIYLIMAKNKDSYLIRKITVAHQ